MKQKIADYCKTLGLDTVGFIAARPFEELKVIYNYRKEKGLENPFETPDLNNRIYPTAYLPEVKTIISIAFPYWDGQVIKNGFSRYTQRLDYHHVLDKYLQQITMFIEKLGGRAKALVDSHGLPERYIAYLAGVGTIGKNNMLYTEKYGSYVFLGEILTDLELEQVASSRNLETLMQYSQCGACEKCLKVCPTQVLHLPNKQTNRCVSYLTQKKELDIKEINLLGGRLFGCDTCQLVCPLNEAVSLTPLELFKTLPMLGESPLAYLELDNATFKEVLKPTACGFRGKNIIRRNALFACQNKKTYFVKNAHNSPYLQYYINLLENTDGTF